MKTLNVKLNFLWDDYNEILRCELHVPVTTNLQDIMYILEKEHEYLTTKDPTDRYGTCGRNPATLLDYVSEKYGWLWTKLCFDIDMDFE